MSDKKKDVNLTDLEAGNSEDVKGGSGLAITQTAFSSINVGSLSPTISQTARIPGAVNNQIDPSKLAGMSTVMCPW